MTAVLDDLFRAEWGHLLSAQIRPLGDFDLAEVALQEAFTIAVTEWAEDGVPRNPRAWLYGTARHKAIDRLRRRQRFAEKQPEVAAELAQWTVDPDPFGEESAVPDERLRLIFTCCHPALAPEAQVALTLRTLCGLKTEEIARAFMVPSTTMGQRLARAKAKIRNAGIPYRVPPAEELSDRLNEVMAVLYLVFNEGYMAAQGEALLRHELCGEAIRLTRLLRSLLQTLFREPDPEVDALLALLLLHDARRPARVDDAGRMVLLRDQDRSRWNREEIEEGRQLVKTALRRGPSGAYAIEAAIAAVHAEAATAEATDWQQIALLYRHLHAVHPSPVVVLNGAVAVSMAEGPAAALPLVEALAEELDSYHLFHATRADLLRRLGRNSEAAASYRRAHALAANEAERRFLSERIAEVDPS